MMTTEFCGTSFAAKKLGLSVGTVQALVEKNELKAWKTEGGHRRISMQSITDYQRRYGRTGEELKDPHSPLKVLLVDGTSETFDLIQGMSHEGGAPVECVWITSALKALINFKSIQPDILIADLSMPSVDGCELLRTVRASHLTNSLSLVGLTAADSTDIDKDHSLPPHTALVQKPVHAAWFHGYLAAQMAIRNA